MGNAAESGSGGGIRLQDVNGTDVVNFPNHSPMPWNTSRSRTTSSPTTLRVGTAAAFAAGRPEVNIVNNTIVSNDTTASAGVLFNTIGAPLASAPGATNQRQATGSAPQPAGLVTMVNSSNLTATFAGLSITCPAGHPNCKSFSNPLMANDVFWQNRSYFIGVGPLSPTYQQNIVSLYNSFTARCTEPALSGRYGPNGNGVVITGGTGACTNASYWDIGVRGDKGPGNDSRELSPTYTVLTDASENGADEPGS